MTHIHARIFDNSGKWLLGSALVFIALLGFVTYFEEPLFYALPVALLAIYSCVFHSTFTLFLIIAFVPFSINIEHLNTAGIGMFIPTEPLCIGLMVLLLLQSLRKSVFPHFIWNSPVVWVILFYLFWLLITTIASEHPFVSFKFIVSKLWFIIPFLFFSPWLWLRIEFVRLFNWLLISAMVVTTLYTTIHHSMYRFGEKESHWVMQPLFKDHTIYGATVAMIFPLAIAFYFSRKHNALVQFLFIGFILILGLGVFFSYTRGAWLSIIFAVGVWAIIRFRIKFSILLSCGFAVMLYVWFSWTSIQQNLAKNKNEHTTEEMADRLSSATNVSTDASNLERLNRWNCALEMFYERPFFGFGPGTYAMEYARFQEPEHKTIISTNFGILGNAHSEFLGPLSEMGLIGMLLMFALVSAIFYSGITLYYRLDSQVHYEQKTLVMGMIIALTTYWIHALINNYFDTDKAAVPIWCMCAIFISWHHQLDKKANAEISNSTK
jgi:putative inorganic carbon (hco3(-)) transporter